MIHIPIYDAIILYERKFKIAFNKINLPLLLIKLAPLFGH